MKPEYKPFVDELIELCIREDIGDGDHTSLSCIPADEHGRMRLLCKQGGHDRRDRNRATRSATPRSRNEIRTDPARRRPCRARRRGLLRLGTPALAASGRAHPAEHHAAHERRGDPDHRLRQAAGGTSYQGPRHAQDHARHARAGQDGREDRRRREPPHGPLRHDPAEGQPHRLRRRHPPRDRRCAPIPRGQRQDDPHRVRGPHAGRHRRGVRGGRRRPHHVRQLHPRNDPPGGREGRRTLREPNRAAASRSTRCATMPSAASTSSRWAR